MTINPGTRFTFNCTCTVTVYLPSLLICSRRGAKIQTDNITYLFSVFTISTEQF